MKHTPSGRPAVTALVLGLCAWCASGQAQNSFNDKLPPGRAPAPSGAVRMEAPSRGFNDNPPSGRAPAPAPPTAPAPLGAPPSDRSGPSAPNVPATVNAGEAQDFGVRPVSQLRPSDQLHAPTPTSIPGGRVVGTQQLAQWMQGQQGAQGKVMLLHAIGSPSHLPNAIAVAPASQGGSFEDQVQRDFGDYLQKATGGDRARLMVTYCQGVQCWGSYNAALRAIHLGYKNVHWYRGGIEAWHQAGLPVLTASGQNGSPAQQQPQPPVQGQPPR